METGEWITGRVVLRVGGRPFEMEMTVPAKPVKPHRMLPVFQQMANSVVGLSVEAVEAAGKEISCKAGCGACCCHPVPLAEIEVYQIAELVEALPEPRRSEIKKRFADASAHFTKMNWFERVSELTALPQPDDPDYVPTEILNEGMRYFREGIACPFLENGSCSIHQARPLACREYLVTSPAVNCSNPTVQTIDKVRLLLHPSRSLRSVGKTGKLARWGILPLIRALEFAEAYPEDFAEKTGDGWASDFFQQLTGTAVPKEGIKVRASRPGKPLRKRMK